MIFFFFFFEKQIHTREREGGSNTKKLKKLKLRVTINFGGTKMYFGQQSIFKHTITI